MGTLSPVEHTIVDMSRPSWNISLKDLSLSLENKKTGEIRRVLNRCWEQANAGEVVAVLGPSVLVNLVY